MKGFVVVFLMELLLFSCVEKDEMGTSCGMGGAHCLSDSVHTIDSRKSLKNRADIIVVEEQKCAEEISKMSWDGTFEKKVSMYDILSIPFVDSETGFERKLDRRGKILTLFVMFCVYAAIVLFYWDKKNQRKRMESMEEKLGILESKYLRARQIVEQVQDMRQRKVDFRHVQECLEICRRKFIDTFEGNILNNVHQINNGDYLPEKERLILRNTLLEDFENIRQEVKNTCPGLTEEDYVYCFFSYVGLSNSIIATCMATSCEALRKRKSRLHGKLTEEFYSLFFGK